jgi:uncharacterized membrane protein YdjX (TVP38/TMEM64 family)/endonuclease/exonuclease/phosphatase family metal-dependent hydrolase
VRQLGVTAEDEWSAVLADQPMIDPAEPVDVDSLLSDVVARSERKPASGRIVAIALIVFALAALALAWRYTPLREWINVESLVHLSDRFEASPFAPLIVIGGFVLGGLLVIPLTMLIAATGIVFGPWLGMLYSLLGATLSAVFVYGIGREVGRDAVRRVAGRRINDLSRRIAKRGLLAMLFVRIVPVAPFSIINLVAGASHLGFRDFLIGTILGLLPGTILISFFVDRIIAAVRHPGPVTFALLALVAGVAIAGTLAVRTRSSGAMLPTRAIRPRRAPTDRAAMASSTITVATYNIHDAVGGDGKFSPERIVAVLAEIDADIIALQEVGSDHDGVDTLERLRDATGLNAVSGPARWRAAGAHGNCLLSRHPIVECTHLDLTYQRREARSALDAVVDCEGTLLRVLATHLGLRPAERRAQVRSLLKALEAETPHPTLLMGDLNEWFLWGRPLRWLHRHFRKTPSRAAFRARTAAGAGSHLGRARVLLQRLWVHASPAARGIRPRSGRRRHQAARGA